MEATETGGTWGQAAEVTPPSNRSSHYGQELYGVSCPSTGNCVVVGDYNDTSGADQAMVATEIPPPTTSVLIPSNGATLSRQPVARRQRFRLGRPGWSIMLSGGTYNDQVISRSPPTYSAGWPARTPRRAERHLHPPSVATYAGGANVTSPSHHHHGEQPAADDRRAPSVGRGHPVGDSGSTPSASANVTTVRFELTRRDLSDQVISGSPPPITAGSEAGTPRRCPNGTYTLQSVASYAGGVTGTSVPASLSRSTTRRLAPPSSPVGRGDHRGTVQFLDARARPGDFGQFELTGGTLSDQVISRSTPTYYGWIGAMEHDDGPQRHLHAPERRLLRRGVSGTSPASRSLSTTPRRGTIIVRSNNATVDGHVRGARRLGVVGGNSGAVRDHWGDP